MISAEQIQNCLKICLWCRSIARSTQCSQYVVFERGRANQTSGRSLVLAHKRDAHAPPACLYGETRCDDFRAVTSEFQVVF
jgi:hypothetical protein